MEKYCEAGQATEDTIWRMCNACCIPTATDTHSEYVISAAFPLQQGLHESVSMLRYTYITRLTITKTKSVYCAVRTGYLHTIRVNQASPVP